MKKIAITGGLSSGKSTICKLLKDKGAYCVSADEIVHQLLSPKTAVGEKILTILGPEIVRNHEFDRNKIAERVFENKEILTSVEHILHPAVLEEVENQYNQVKDKSTHTLFVAEIPLLYEIESAHLFETVITVTSDPRIAKQRFEEKTDSPQEEFEKRMTHQMPVEEKCAQADYTITNNGDLASLKQQVETLYQQLTQ